MKQIFTLLTLLTCTLAMAQLPVSQTPEKKKILIEEYNGIHCQFCPDGHRVTNGIQDDHGDNAIVINVHTGQYANPGAGDPDFRTAFGGLLAGQTGLTGYPAATFNRQVILGSTTALTNFGNYWKNAANTVASQDAYVNVALEADIDVQTRVLTVDVELYYTATAGVSTNNLNVVLTQSNIVAFQGNLNENPSQVTPEGLYNHDHALRHMITGQWGEEITTVTAGTTVSKTYTYTLPAIIGNLDVDLADLEVVAFVAEGQQEIINGNTYHPTISNFTHDANVTVEEFQINGIKCDTEVLPYVTVRNNGNDNISNIEFEYSVNGGSTETFTWVGSGIEPGHYRKVGLPAIEYVSAMSNMAEVTITKVNGGSDELGSDNEDEVSFDRIGKYYVQKVQLELWTDRWATETSWKLMNVTDGGVVASSESYPDLGSAGVTEHNYTFDVLPNKCYYFEMLDFYGDGICSGAGNGRFELTAGGKTILEGCDFGAHMKVFFSTDPASFELGSILAEETHPTSEGDPTVHNTLTPNSLPMTLRWYLVDLDVPNGWTEELAVCDDVECHISTLTTYEYTVTETGPTVLDAHFINNNLEGVGTARLLVYDVADSAFTAIYADFKLTVTDNPTGVFDQQVELVEVYPNPTTSSLYLKGLEGTGIKSIEVFNSIGSRVMETPFNFMGEQHIDVSSLQNGMYMIRMFDAQREVWMGQSFIKQ